MLTLYAQLHVSDSIHESASLVDATFEFAFSVYPTDNKGIKCTFGIIVTILSILILEYI